jgi:lipopolysaccharide heptosyltransferase III
VNPIQPPAATQSSNAADPSSLLPGLPQGSEILIIRLRSLGDLILETPAIAALKAWRSDLRISVLVEPRFASVLEANPNITEIISSGGLGVTSLELRRRKFSVVFNQHGGPRSAMLTGASGSPWRVGWKDYQYSFLYNVQVPDAEEFYSRSAVHAIEHRISQFYWTGLPRGPIPRTQIFPQMDTQDLISQMLADRGISRAKGYAVIQPGARLPGMRWPLSKFADIARWLKTTHEIASVVNCVAQEGEVSKQIRDEMGGCATIADRMNIRELVALISGARLFVGNDSGPAHIASALQRPAVVIFGQTDPAQWRPLHPTSRVVSTGAEFSHPRGDKAILSGQPPHISSISLDEVRDACTQLLSP